MYSESQSYDDEIKTLPLVGGANSAFKPTYTLVLAYKSHLLQVIENVLSSSTLDEIQSSEVKNLKNAILHSQSSQISKQSIVKFLEQLVGTYISSKSLIDINLGLENNKFCIVGRPEVEGSSTKQMRHVSPFSFVTSVICTAIEQAGENTATLFSYLKVSLMSFIRYDHGISIKKEVYDKLCSDLGYMPDICILKTTLREYYLLDEKNSLLYLNEIDENPYSEYKQKKEKFVMHALDILEAKLNDDNTFLITSEAIARLITTLYNTKPYVAFPDEGNSINEEIRLYKSEQDAATPKKAKEPPIILTQKELCHFALIKPKEYDKKIRLVNNEGSIIKKVLEALKALNNIAKKLELGIDVHQELKEYNKKFSPLDNLNFETLGICIAENLYLAFDFKPLEEKVFVPSLPKENKEKEEHILVYPSAIGKAQSLYTVRDGNTYREEQVNAAIKHYNTHVTFRTDKKVTNYEVLLTLIKNHIKLASLAFTDFISENIGFALITHFVNLLKNDYNFDDETKKKFITDCRSSLYDTDMDSIGNESLAEEISMSGAEGIISMEMYLN